MNCQRKPLRVVALGTYDKGKPRTRILLRGLRENGVQVIECHQDVWKDVEDKSQIQGLVAKFMLAWQLVAAYPVLMWRYFRLPSHDVVLIGYLGLFDVLLLWPLVRFRRAVLVWDVFISLYNTVVEDRALLRRKSPMATVLWSMEWLALRLVDVALIDTQAHANYLQDTYGCEPNKVRRIYVGAEPELFNLSAHGLEPVDPADRPMKVLFYGQFIPLHGIETIVKAAKLTEKKNVQWLLIGKGQESSKIRALVEELQPTNLEWIEWVKYEKLIRYLAESHVVLGIFGTTEKARRVIPNKVFQILAAGRPMITGDTPAIRELLAEGDGIRFVPTGNARALAQAVCDFCEGRIALHKFRPVPEGVLPVSIGKELLVLLKDCIEGKSFY